MSEGKVVLGVEVWPLYVGVTDGAAEPTGIDYQRGQILWNTHPDGQVLGAARVYVPKGTWTHYVFYSGPQPAATVMGIVVMEHPIVFDRAGIVDVDPIRNRDIMPRLL